MGDSIAVSGVSFFGGEDGGMQSSGAIGIRC